MIARLDVQELVDVTDQHPIGLARQRMRPSGLECLPLDRVSLLQLVLNKAHDAGLLQGFQKRNGAVAAIIGKDQKIRDPGRPMMGDPFQKVRPFIPHRRDA